MKRDTVAIQLNHYIVQYEQMIKDPTLKHKDLQVAVYLRENGGAPAKVIANALFRTSESKSAKGYVVNCYKSLKRLSPYLTIDQSGIEKIYSLRNK